jgi:hypothetical protein
MLQQLMRMQQQQVLHCAGVARVASAPLLLLLLLVVVLQRVMWLAVVACWLQQLITGWG